jgi:hypothetical protein
MRKTWFLRIARERHSTIGVTAFFSGLTGRVAGSVARQKLLTGQRRQSGGPALQTIEPRSMSAEVCWHPPFAGRRDLAAFSKKERPLAVVISP